MHLNTRIEKLRRRNLLALSLIVACSALIGCSSDGTDRASVSPVATVIVDPSVTPLSGPPVIGSIVWTTSVDPATKAPAGGAPPTVRDLVIYAVAPIESLPAGSQLIARWYFNGTSLDGLNSSMRIDQDRVAGWLEFHIERVDGDSWPDGEYEIVISDGSTDLQRSRVRIS